MLKILTTVKENLKAPTMVLYACVLWYAYSNNETELRTSLISLALIYLTFTVLDTVTFDLALKPFTVKAVNGVAMYPKGAFPSMPGGFAMPSGIVFIEEGMDPTLENAILKHENTHVTHNDGWAKLAYVLAATVLLPISAYLGYLTLGLIGLIASALMYLSVAQMGFIALTAYQEFRADDGVESQQEREALAEFLRNLDVKDILIKKRIVRLSK